MDVEKSKCDFLEKAVKKAKSFGAEHVDLTLKERQITSATTRLTKLEKLVQASVVEIDMRVAVGKRYAAVSCDNLDRFLDDSFIENAVAAAKNSPEENLKIRADFSELCTHFKEIDICDNAFSADPKYFIEKAQKCEEIALQVKGISNSEGAESSHSRAKFTLMRDDRFLASYEKTSNQISVVTLAEKDGDLESDYAYSTAVYDSDLKNTKDLAQEAAEKTLRKLGSRKVKSCKVPVIFNRETSRQLLNSMLSALSGAAVARGMSFLKDSLGKKVFSDNISIIDKYAVQRGLRSRPFDADGLECRDTKLVTNGVVSSFLLNTKYANKMGSQSTANANGWDEISPNNACIENGKRSFHDIVAGIKSGLYVTNVMGMGIDIVTGNYSQGAAGFWIENGEISYPVNEITVASNFIEMFSHCDVASDLILEYGIDSPSVFFEEMIVGGV